ncbi:unnamed protein product [Urochloa humidicola]
MAAMSLGRQGEELLAQLREQLYCLPSPATSSGGGRRRRRGSKRGRHDDKSNNGEEEPAAQPRYSGRKRKTTTKLQKSTSSLVTSVPDFDGYQWRKYGQKQIEGAMYARSYYRCTRSAEQGCLAKRTVQRNDGGDDGGPAPEYTVVYMGEHTCTANDSLQAPVILETTATVVPAASTSTNKQQRRPQDDEGTTIITSRIVPTTSAGSCSSTTTTGTGTIESPTISDDITWNSSGSSDDYSGLFPVYDSWTPAASLQEMEDFTGPIRSPIHIAADGWTIDHFLLQLPNEPLCHFS